MRGSRAKSLRKLARELEKNPPPGFVDLIERYAGDFMFESQELTTMKPIGWKRVDGFIRRVWANTHQAEGHRQRNLYRWVKRLYRRGKLPEGFVSE